MDNPIRPVVIWWDDSPGDMAPAWAFDHYEVTLPGGDEFGEANDSLGPDADLKSLLRALRKAVGSHGYVPHAYKWTRDERGRWIAPPKVPTP